MDNELILPVTWIGLFTYTLLTFIYLYHVIREYKVLKFANIKIIIVIGFAVLAFHCLEVILYTYIFHLFLTFYY